MARPASPTAQSNHIKPQRLPPLQCQSQLGIQTPASRSCLDSLLLPFKLVKHSASHKRSSHPWMHARMPCISHETALLPHDSNHPAPPLPQELAQPSGSRRRAPIHITSAQRSVGLAQANVRKETALFSKAGTAYHGGRARSKGRQPQSQILPNRAFPRTPASLRNPNRTCSRVRTQPSASSLVIAAAAAPYSRAAPLLLPGTGLSQERVTLCCLLRRVRSPDPQTHIQLWLAVIGHSQDGCDTKAPSQNSPLHAPAVGSQARRSCI